MASVIHSLAYATDVLPRIMTVYDKTGGDDLNVGDCVPSEILSECSESFVPEGNDIILDQSCFWNFNVNS